MLDLYNNTEGPLDSAALHEAQALVDAATAVLLHLQSSSDRGGLHGELAGTVHDRAEVHRRPG